MADTSRYAVGFRVTCAFTFHPLASILIIVGYNQIFFGYAFRNLIRVIGIFNCYWWFKGSSFRTEVVNQTDNIGSFRR